MRSWNALLVLLLLFAIGYCGRSGRVIRSDRGWERVGRDDVTATHTLLPVTDRRGGLPIMRPSPILGTPGQPESFRALNLFEARNRQMPELPEVQTVVTTLRPRVLGRRIVAVVSVRQDIVSPADFDVAGRLCGRSVRAVERRGKRIVFTLDDDNRFYIHLGMTGQLSVAQPD